MLTINRSAETRDQAIHRLAREARAQELRVFEHLGTGRFYVSSHTAPDLCWEVSLLHCECPHFVRDHACRHHSALLHHLGELPVLPSPSTPTTAVVECPACDRPMRHLAGVSFECVCGATYAIDWATADRIDEVICRRSQGDDDGQFEDVLERLLSVDGDRVPAGVDPDMLPSRSDTPGILGWFDVDPNAIAAVLTWKADLDAREEVAA
jgi:hypothetical protein